MKKIYIYISLFAFAALAFGCSKEVDIQDELPGEGEVVATGDGETITVTLSVPESEDTKTTLGAKSGSTYPVYWSSNDVITLNGIAATEFTPASGNATATAKFGKINNLTAPYNFLYCGVSGQPNQVSFPSAQSYVSGGFDPAAMPMYASVTDLNGTIAFSHVAALLKFSLTCESEKKIDSVTLTAADGSKSLSGNFTIGATNGILNGGLTPASGGGTINYNFGGHKTLGDTPFIFYVAIPAGTYDGGITLDIVDNARGHMAIRVLDSDATKTIAAGTVREFADVVYVPETDANLKMIWNATTFQEFVTAVAGGNKTLNARLTPNADSINLSSIAGSFESIEDYEGTFDGNGKTLNFVDDPHDPTPTQPLFANLKGVVKNLTVNAVIETTASSTSDGGYHWGIFAKQIIPSLESDDIAGLQNCTASGSITWTPSAAIDSYMTLGGLVGNNRGGIITGCINNATVTFALTDGVTHTNQPSVGGVVGRTQKGGELNTQGDISNCTNNGAVTCSANFSQGAYIGGVVGYQVEMAESMSGCVNHGEVKATSTFSTSGALHIGGVIGMGKGNIESCTNASDGKVTTVAGSTAGSYIKQGGVVGRLNSSSGTYSGLTNAGEIYAAASGASSGAYIGGVAGCCNEGASISGCTNTGGKIEYTGSISTCELHIGGIVGNTNREVSSCSNATAIDVKGSYSRNASGEYLSIGGIVGYQNGDYALTDNTNTAAITFSGTTGGYLALAGICGYCKGIISGGGNSGTVTYAGSSSAQNIPMGGIVARTPGGKTGTRINGVANSGSVVVNTSTHSGKYVFVGGIIGDHQSGDVLATNSGTIIVSRLSCTQLQLGGLIGQVQSGAILSGSANLSAGDISISNMTSSQQSYIGGIVGKNEGPVTANNAGDITVESTSTINRSFYLGGIVGRSAAALTYCTNSGAINNAGQMSGGDDYYMQIGGVVGYNNGSAPLSYCHNTGAVSNTANSGAYLYVGGITSESDAMISHCDNTGDVTNSGNSGNSHSTSVGGIAGVISAGMEYSSNGTTTAAGGTISNSGTSAGHIYVAGVYGYSIENGSLSHCYNKGVIANSGDVPSSSQVWVGGAVGKQDNQGSDNTKTNYNVGIGSVISNVTNSGAVSNDALCTGNLNMGGIVAEAFGAVDNCTNSGPVDVNANVAKSVYMGGILGYWQTNPNNSVSYCENTASGTVTIAPGINIEGQIFCSGVIGGEEGAIEATNSHLINRAAITLGADSSDGAITSNSIGNKTYSYISGVGGGNGESYVAYEYCENYGRILFRTTMHRSRVGGVVACAFRSPDHSKCEADIRFYKSRGGNYKDDIGGVIGYYKAETDHTINDILYKGYLNTQSNSPRGYTAGLVGRVNNDAITFTDCKLGGQIRGVGTSPYNTVAFVCCAVAEHEINVTNLIVETGTKRNTTAVTSLSLNKSTTGTVGVLCFGTTSETNTTDLDPASSGTMTNCTIGSISAYL